MDKIRLGLLVLVCSISVSGCASMPQSGSVNHYANQIEANSAAPTNAQEPASPQEGASPEEIIRGFLSAGAGVHDDFSVARKYLTDSMGSSWHPDDKTLVYSSNYTVEQKSQDSFTVTLPIAAKIDGKGIATSYPSGNQETVSFSCEQVNGQWRIKDAPQGLILSQNDFNKDFGPYTLFFYDPSYQYLVPDVRWLANRATTVTSLVRLTLSGPAPYLQGAVKPATDTAITLVRNSVPVLNGTAQIDMVSGNSSSISQNDIDRLTAQLKQTLNGILGIQNVEMTLDNKSVSTSASFSPKKGSDQPTQIVGLTAQGVIEAKSLQDLAPLKTFSTPSAVVDVALNPSGDAFAALNPVRDQLLLGNEQESKWVLSAQNLTRPSFDPYSWLWTADSGGVVHAVKNDKSLDSVSLNTHWLEGVQISSLNISHGGTRVLITGKVNGNSQAWVAGIIRDPISYKPIKIGDPVQIESGSNLRADWLTDSKILVGDLESGKVEVVSLSGDKEYLAGVKNLATVNAGNGGNDIIASDNSQNLFHWNGVAWEPVETDVKYLNFSG